MTIGSAQALVRSFRSKGNYCLWIPRRTILPVYDALENQISNTFWYVRNRAGHMPAVCQVSGKTGLYGYFRAGRYQFGNGDYPLMIPSRW